MGRESASSSTDSAAGTETAPAVSDKMNRRGFIQKQLHGILCFASIVPMSILSMAKYDSVLLEKKRDMVATHVVEVVSKYAIVIMTLCHSFFHLILKDLGKSSETKDPPPMAQTMEELYYTLIKDVGTLLYYAQISVAFFYSLMRNHAEFIWPLVDFFGLTLVSVCRLFTGSVGAYYLESCNRPKQFLILYEYEASSVCKRVREVLSVLEIDHIVYPCPRPTLKKPTAVPDGRFSAKLHSTYGKVPLPFLVDPNTGAQLSNGSSIVEYLWTTYGDKAKAPLNYRMATAWGFLTDITLFSHLVFRPMMDMGVLRIPSKLPEVYLQLWGYESSPSSKKVRELLCCLELPYEMHEMPLFSKKRYQFLSEHQKYLSWISSLGFCSLPCLHDKNTGKIFFGAKQITNYLQKTYQDGDVPVESWADFGM